MAKKSAKKTEAPELKFPVEAYSVKSKKVVPVQDGRITKTTRGAYMLHGVDEEGNKVTGIISQEKAEHWIEKGACTQDF